MRKKLLFVVTIAICIGICLLFFEFFRGKKITNENISERSKEFLKSQKKDSILTTGNSNAIPSDIAVDNCFSFHIPWEIAIAREDGVCDWHYFTAKPKLNINVYLREVSFTSLDDDPGIRLRKKRAAIYEESHMESNGRNFTVFHKKSAPYEASAFYLKDNSLFVINILSYGSDNLDAELKKILDSTNITQ